MVKEEQRIVVGASGQKYPGWQSYRQEELDLLCPEQWAAEFVLGSLDAILAEHVWEHLDFEQGVTAARICHGFLRPGGYVRCAVPDGYYQSRWYQDMVQVGGPGPADHPAADHRIVHTYKSLVPMFRQAGFRVELLEWCDAYGRFHYQHWDPTAGKIQRSLRFDTRNQDGCVGFASLIVDAVKPYSLRHAD